MLYLRVRLDPGHELCWLGFQKVLPLAQLEQLQEQWGSCSVTAFVAPLAPSFPFRLCFTYSLSLSSAPGNRLLFKHSCSLEGSTRAVARATAATATSAAATELQSTTLVRDCGPKMCKAEQRVVLASVGDGDGGGGDGGASSERQMFAGAIGALAAAVAAVVVGWWK